MLKKSLKIFDEFQIHGLLKKSLKSFIASSKKIILTPVSCICFNRISFTKDKINSISNKGPIIMIMHSQYIDFYIKQLQ